MAAEEFAARRKRLADALPPGGIAVIPAASRTFMTGAIPYGYRQAKHLLHWHAVRATTEAEISDLRADIATELPHLHVLWPMIVFREMLCGWDVADWLVDHGQQQKRLSLKCCEV